MHPHLACPCRRQEEWRRGSVRAVGGYRTNRLKEGFEQRRRNEGVCWVHAGVERIKELKDDKMRGEINKQDK